MCRSLGSLLVDLIRIRISSPLGGLFASSPLSPIRKETLWPGTCPSTAAGSRSSPHPAPRGSGTLVREDAREAVLHAWRGCAPVPPLPRCRSGREALFDQRRGREAEVRRDRTPPPFSGCGPPISLAYPWKSSRSNALGNPPPPAGSRLAHTRRGRRPPPGVGSHEGSVVMVDHVPVASDAAGGPLDLLDRPPRQRRYIEGRLASVAVRTGGRAKSLPES